MPIPNPRPFNRVQSLTACGSEPLAAEALVREMLERADDKWTLLVIEELGSGGQMGVTQLRDRIGGESQQMLTKTARELERDGLVTRTNLDARVSSPV